MNEPVYETIWRNKFLCTECKSLAEMIGVLEGAAATLKEMLDTGKITLESGQEDDYATFVTTDKDVAKRFDFRLREDFDEEDDGDDENE